MATQSTIATPSQAAATLVDDSSIPATGIGPRSASREPVQFLSSRLKQNDVSLLPYAKVDGGWTLSDEIVLNLAREYQKDGTFTRVFCEGVIETPEQFLEAMKNPANAPVFIYRGFKPIGVAWLNGFSGNIAFAHFCFLVSAWGPDTERAGRMVVDYWMTFPAIQVLIGTTPETSGPAAKYAERLGFVRLGAIPRFIHDAYHDRHVAAIVLYYVRP